MNEVKIQIPDNCELIKDGDTYIVREKKQKSPKSWEEFCKNYPIKDCEYYITSDSNIDKPRRSQETRVSDIDRNICTSKEEAEAFLALMQLRQLRKAWVGDWKPTKREIHWSIFNNIAAEEICINPFSMSNTAMSFPTKEIAEDFLSCFRDLCETAKILL